MVLFSFVESACEKASCWDVVTDFYEILFGFVRVYGNMFFFSRKAINHIAIVELKARFADPTPCHCFITACGKLRKRGVPMCRKSWLKSWLKSRLKSAWNNVTGSTVQKFGRAAQADFSGSGWSLWIFMSCACCAWRNNRYMLAAETLITIAACAAAAFIYSLSSSASIIFVC